MNMKKGVPIGNRFAPADGDLKPVVEVTLALIDNVHSSLYLPTIPIRYSDAASPFGRYVPGDGRPEYIQLSLRSPHKRLSLAHEIGHLLDHALGKYVVYSSQERSSPLADVIHVANESEAVKRLRAAIANIPAISAGVDARQILYWLEPVEIWARVYAQYIALRSGSYSMLAEVIIAQNLQPFAAYHDVQWDSDDLDPVAAAIDLAFGKLGWR